MSESDELRNAIKYGSPKDASDLPEEAALDAVETAKTEDRQVAFTFCKYGHTSETVVADNEGSLTVGTPDCAHRPVALLNVVREFWRAPTDQHVEFLDDETYAMVAAASQYGMVHCYRRSPSGRSDYFHADEMKLFHGCTEYEYEPLFGGLANE